MLADETSLRDWWYAPPEVVGSKNPPPAGSRADFVVKAAQVVLSGVGASASVTQEMLNAAIAASAQAIGTAMAIEFVKHVKVQ